MVWMFIIATIITFSFVLKYVLTNVMAPEKKNFTTKSNAKSLPESTLTTVHTYK